MESSEKKSILNDKICGMPIKFFVPISIVIWVIAFVGKLPTDVFATMIFLWTLGSFLQWVGNKTPVLGKYIGFGGILPLFGASLLVTVGLVNADLAAQCKSFTSGTIIPFLIGILMCGALLGRLDRKTLLAAALRYIPVIIIGEICAIAGSFFLGKLLGIDLFHSVVLVAFPCFSGGSGGPLGAIPTAISSALGIDGSEFVGYMMAAATLANVEAILLSGMLDLVGKKFPKLTGNGTLVRKQGQVSTESGKKTPFNGNFEDLFRAFVIMGIVVISGNVIAGLMKPIINLNYLVYVIVICIAIKVSGILPEDWENSFAHWMGFALPLLLPTLIAGMGIGSIDLVATFKAINPQFFVLVTGTVLFFVLGSMLGGYLVGFYPVEAGISVGCCSCNIGGTGDIICCETAHRMNLYPFASLSTRLGSSFALLWLGLILGYVHL